MTAGLERSMLSFVQERVAALERRLERYDPDTASEAFTDGAPSLAINSNKIKGQKSKRASEMRNMKYCRTKHL